MAVTNLVPGASQEQSQSRGGFARVWRTLRQLFHEIVGGIFLVLSLAWLQSAIRAYARDVARWLVGLAFGIAVGMAVFAWTSFRRARQLR